MPTAYESGRPARRYASFLSRSTAGGVDLSPLGMHRMVGQRLDRDRAERVEPDVQRHFHRRSTPDGSRLPQQIGGEVQTGGRRRDRSRFACVDGLITLAVGGDHFAGTNVVGQRNSASQLEQFEIAPRLIARPRDRPGQPNSPLVLGHQFEFQRAGPKIGGQLDPLAGKQFSAGFAEQLPGPLAIGSKKQPLPMTTGRFPPAGANQCSRADDS